MFSALVEAAMEKARYRQLEDGTYYGEIEVYPEVYAVGQTLEECRQELEEVLVEWLRDRLSRP
ncbi:type II toxin-antitoxin system HicB family antitoxin [Thermoflexus sp.]|uniref:type II toxin-antitoxin system HicB family antitoxin n=1 Tax=Thermoflexus sp. TaxID=1969742 RepID=UPI0025DDFDF5|nr:type II toxin-antitoxin system HicB family antitoxin [Thermoflexus sp.]MDW8180689.1 type II toxin-antitoxin system HicB family antitoxin [Anaerolineae bacterium]MCS6963742.1 type II toxin-antitoxin system HicB family antitoxin [Thermoflexus sp.]MCS7252112.1 type II toxin-antitoxin system HicB family antitoxin [Thermoflexus sp.]MCS7351235.1 type II toxin-antitoxin system HicB family antitoxin [Thermoflexus sp.]MCX7689733.1 type II toxin-antitoxin system HicB family antitoxin [Thermoflexus sp